MVGVANKNSTVPRSHLEEINIRGLGVIDQALVEFTPGLNVITGETGAGKTMILTALSLLLGGKADSDLVRSTHERLSVSGTFAINQSAQGELGKLFDEQGLEIDESNALFSRNVTKEGKSRAMINASATTASVLASLGSEFIEIHGQHGSLFLTKTNKQREILDLSGGREFEEKIGAYKKLLEEYSEKKRAVAELKRSLADRDREIEALRGLTEETSRLKPEPNEFLELDALISRLESVEDLRIAATGAQQALSDEDAGALNSLHQAKRFFTGARGKDQELDSLHEKASDALFTLIDVASDLDRYVNDLSADPQALESALSRRAALSSFIKRYGDSTEKNDALNEAIAKAAKAKERIRDLSGGDERIKELEEELIDVRKRLVASANEVSSQRIKSADEISIKVTNELHALAMPKAKFKVDVSSHDTNKDESFSPWGVDEVAMLFTSHNGGDLLPISKAASGGELSRLMLAIEVVIAERYPVGTYVFDEVDAGVGGKAALDVGRRLRHLADSAQVIVVTHLPQVALWADNHIVVEKDVSGAVTESTIRRISDHDREREIARMLSGVEGSEHAQEHARELLNLRITARA